MVTSDDYTYILIKGRCEMKTVSLKTDFENDLLNCDIPFSEYPRPQLKRDSYLCLNGKWNFRIENKGKTSYKGEIVVPFVPESRISGVEHSITKKDYLIYERNFVIKEDFLKDKTILHIGACDQYASVHINGRLVGKNEGGYLPFKFDITKHLKIGENTLKIIARDPLDKNLPYGKQTAKRGGMWYTKISGIWQTVWLESVIEKYIENIKISPDLKGVNLKIMGGEDLKTLIFEGKEYSFRGEYFRLDVENPILWTEENPHLYEFEIISGSDKVSSYFGLRTVSFKEIRRKSYILLNGKPKFFHGVLDQGYFSDGIFLPASERGYKEDILKMKDCGFNMLRKHIKLEPDLFYYYCDKYGMLVFQDFINSGNYSFLIDTALPTVFLKKGISHHAGKRRKQAFEKASEGIMDFLYNHPSVVYYTIFNEGWGQFSADKYYSKFKAYDPSRVFDTASGWFKPEFSDVDSEHVYFKPISLKAKRNKPLILSEFGGYSFKVENHSFNLQKNYGYKFFKKQPEFEQGLFALYENEIIPTIKKGLSGAVLTQLSDVEDETNGLLTYDRKVLKIDADKMAEVSEKIYKAFDRKTQRRHRNKENL